jgi:hypothetical protein
MALEGTSVNFVEYARVYSALGWSVFPLRPRSKEPATSWKRFQQSQASATEIDSFFGDGSNNLAIVTGDRFGIVLDVDGHKGGFESLHKFEVATTLSLRTGSGGRHYIYKHPGGRVCNAQKFAGLAGVDIRADGGYIVAPPSIHPNGVRYEWLPGLGPDDMEPQPLPQWLNDALREVAGAAAAVESRERAKESGPPKLLELILPACSWLRHTRDDAAELSEWEWYAALTILGRCVDGARLAHEWSRPYLNYTQQETSKKLKHALQAAGPFTCQRIATETGGGWCHKCAARMNGVRSPIALGALTALGDGPRTAFTWGEIVRAEVSGELRIARLVEVCWFALSQGQDLKSVALEWNAKRAKPPLDDVLVEHIVAAVKTVNGAVR